MTCTAHRYRLPEIQPGDIHIVGVCSQCGATKEHRAFLDQDYLQRENAWLTGMVRMRHARHGRLLGTQKAPVAVKAARAPFPPKEETR